MTPPILTNQQRIDLRQSFAKSVLSAANLLGDGNNLNRQECLVIDGLISQAHMVQRLLDPYQPICNQGMAETLLAATVTTNQKVNVRDGFFVPEGTKGVVFGVYLRRESVDDYATDVMVLVVQPAEGPMFECLTTDVIVETVTLP